jgi:hypothetical protein
MGAGVAGGGGIKVVVARHCDCLLFACLW